MRKIIVYIATSADGYIARLDGDVAWLDRPRIAGNYGMSRFYQSIDAVIMGRKTYDLALTFGQESYPGKKNYVFSRRRHRARASNVTFVKEDVRGFAAKLHRTLGKHIWLVGGAELVGTFLDVDATIDEFMIHVIPTFIGEGIPLIHPRHRSVPLVLRSCRRFSDGNGASSLLRVRPDRREVDPRTPGGPSPEVKLGAAAATRAEALIRMVKRDLGREIQSE